MSLHSRMSKENETRNLINENTENTIFDIGKTVFLNKKEDYRIRFMLHKQGQYKPQKRNSICHLTGV